MKTYELVAAGFGIVSVFLSTRQNVWSWPTSLVNVSMYAVYFFHEKLYALMALQAFFAAISLYGWYEWLFGGEAHTTLRVSRIPRRVAGGLGVLGLVTMAAIYVLLTRYTLDPSPGIDAFFFAASLAGQWMMARKYLECWPLWVTINCVSVPFFLLRQEYPTMIQYAVFLVLAGMGWRQWKASLVASS